MKLENLNIGKSEEISYEFAKELLKNTLGEYDFNNLNEDHNTPEIGFETVINRKYYLTKVGKKGSKLYPGTQYEEKAVTGIFEIEMTWDYRHPSNFCQNKNNLSQIFKFCR